MRQKHKWSPLACTSSSSFQ